MRVGQLSRIVRAHYPSEIEVSVRPMAGRHGFFRALSAMLLPKDAVFIVPKRLAYSWPDEAIGALRKATRARAILLDYVDANLDNVFPDGVDVHLSTSFAGKVGLDERLASIEGTGLTRVLLHNVDERVKRVPEKIDAVSLHMLYLGIPKTTYIPDAIRSKLDIRPASTPDEFAVALGLLESANAHYCVRPDPGKSPTRKFKPFTKGFTAAWCGATMLVNRQTDDAAHFLGEDYPYMVDAPTEADICEMHARMCDDVGGPDWCEALGRGRAMADQVSPKKLAKDLHDIIEEVIN